jgi:small subunit ribosomal protein S4
MRGRAGENLLLLLERRLDNVIFRMGFATSRAESRQLLRHGHFTVDGRRVSIPSMTIKSGAVIQVTEKSRKVARIVGALETLESRSVPQWIEINKDGFEGTVKNLPVREDITMPIQEQLIVELYSGAK